MEQLHQAGDVVAERYRIVQILGQGGVGITYEAEDLREHQRVALKALSLHRMTDWKAMELFKREALTLEQLEHPAIPRYFDYFEVDTETDRAFYIAQQLAPGQSLAELSQAGWRPRVAEIRQIAIQVLEVLSYLHQLTPPVIHRDIKPQNIIRQQNGQIFLVDFGAVQDTYHHTVARGSTVVGTFGYMAPEQFRGQASTVTDLYGLGATLVALMAAKDPADLPQRNMKLNFRSHVKASRKFIRWLEQMLEPAVEDRFPSAGVALAALQGHRSLHARQPYLPKKSKITCTKTSRKLVVEIPPVGLGNTISRRCACIILSWLSLSLFVCWLVSASGIPLSAEMDVARAIWVFIVASAGIIIGLRAFQQWFLWAFGTTTLELTPHRFQLHRALHPWDADISTVGETQALLKTKLETVLIAPVLDFPIACALHERVKTHRFGFLLTPQEQRWIVYELHEFLASLQKIGSTREI